MSLPCRLLLLRAQTSRSFRPVMTMTTTRIPAFSKTNVLTLTRNSISIRCRPYSTTKDDESNNSDDAKLRSGGGNNNEWRKAQLQKVENKFSESMKEPSQNIDSDDELQEMWRQMESRVKNRRPRTLRDTGGKTGRVNVKKTDEEIWLREGLYDDPDNAK